MIDSDIPYEEWRKRLDPATLIRISADISKIAANLLGETPSAYAAACSLDNLKDYLGFILEGKYV